MRYSLNWMTKEIEGKGEIEKIDQVAESGLSLLYQGLSLREAAKELGISASHLIKRLTDSEELEKRYARALMCKGVLYAEDIVSLADSLPDKPTREQVAKATIQIDSRKWVGARFWAQLRPEVMERAQASIQVNPGNNSRLVIEVATPIAIESQDVNVHETHPQGVPAQEVIDIETQSQ